MRRLAFALLALVTFPLSALASGSASFSMQTTSGTRVGDEFAVVLTVRGNGESLDTARAYLTFPSELMSVERVTQGGSFPRVSPESSYDNGAGTLSQGGFVVGSTVDGTGTFATVVFVAKKEGTGTIELLGSSRLISNGEERGSGIGSSVTVAIGAATGAPAVVVGAESSADTTPPNPIQPETPRERYLEGDDALLSFATTDDQSGIDHYELSIGNGPYFVATSPYVVSGLKAGDLFIQTKAVDRAGNERFGQTTVRVYSAGTELAEQDQTLAEKEKEQIRALSSTAPIVGRAFFVGAIFAALALGAILGAMRIRAKRSS